VIEQRRRAYLEAMGFEVWLPRPAGPAPGLVYLGPGDGSVLLVCESPEATGSRLAADIARAVGGNPVWAWPDGHGAGQGVTLEQAVSHRLFTQVLLLGQELAESILGGKPPDVLGSAAVTVAPGLQELGERASARQQLWGRISKLGLN
jgi:DNA polymerase III psi subunit